ncbi:hypothetical protein BC940DRAFT_289810 [Gongronella butleri]|nr:hypothetical protein BC940DRAFT_289810 [Gongronella butleri]
MTKRRRTLVTPEKWTQIKQLLSTGLPISAVVLASGICDSTVRKIENHAKMPDYVLKNIPISEEKLEQTKKLLLTMTVAKVAALVGLSDRTVRRVREKYKIPIGDDVPRANFPQARVDKIKDLLLAGKSGEYVIRALRTSSYTIGKIRQRYNIPKLAGPRSESTISKVKQMILAGEGTSKIMKECNVSKQLIYNTRDKYNLPVYCPQKRPISRATALEITRLLAQGKPANAIASKVRVGVNAVHRRQKWLEISRQSKITRTKQSIK